MFMFSHLFYESSFVWQGSNLFISLFMCCSLTALLKKGGGVRPIAVGEVLRRLAGRLCCLIVCPSLPDVFLPYGQVGIGIPGGLECAVHITRCFLSLHSDDDSLALLKVDMKNAINECSRDVCFCPCVG